MKNQYINKFESFINAILYDAYDVNDLLDERDDEIIEKIGNIIDLCEKTLDKKGYLV